MRLKDKVAIITGAGSGIGRASAILFAKEGAKVVVADIACDGGLETVNIIKNNNGEAFFVETDVSKSKDVKKMIKMTLEKFGRLNVLFNNAGISLEKNVTDTTEEELDKVIDVNLKGAFLCSKYALPNMIHIGGGVIVNTASIRGLTAQFHLAAYCASKGGVVLLTKAMAIDYGKFNIRVNCVCPGAIQTPLWDDSMVTIEDPEQEMKEVLKKIPLKLMGRPEDVAQAALFLASDESSYISGVALPVDGGRVLYT
jgi:NAD(P)-dependent dehydrogenase (short-subunit alcohol dehydrogenase family)